LRPRARRDLRDLAVPPNAPWEKDPVTVYEQLLGAHLAVARKAPDAKARLTLVDSLLIDVPNMNEFVGRTGGNFLVSALWEAAGEPERAFTAIKRRNGVFGYGLFAADRQRRTARLAERLGRTDEAASALRHFIAMRSGAEPALQPEVERARERLRQLETAKR